MGSHISKHPKEEKICLRCGRKMTWRKSWAKTWNEVKYCSDACRDKKEFYLLDLLTALIIAFSDEVTILGSIPTPQSV